MDNSMENHPKSETPEIIFWLHPHKHGFKVSIWKYKHPFSSKTILH